MVLFLLLRMSVPFADPGSYACAVPLCVCSLLSYARRILGPIARVVYHDLTIGPYHDRISDFLIRICTYLRLLNYRVHPRKRTSGCGRSSAPQTRHGTSG